MIALLALACLICCAAPLAEAEVAITQSASGWTMTNGQVRLALTRSPRGVNVESLRRTGGAEWAVSATPLRAFLEGTGDEYRFAEGVVTDVSNGAKQLTLQFSSEAGGLLSLRLQLYPTGAVIEFAAKLENRGQRTLPLLFRIDPLCLTLKTPAGGLKPYSSLRGRHGFYPAGDFSSPREFSDWLVLENGAEGESVLIGGEPGAGVLGWRANTLPSAAGILVRAGNILPRYAQAAEPSAYEVAPGERVETPIAFLAVARGDADDAGNETFRYLKRYIFLKPIANAPLAAYCIWLTETNSEEPLLQELKFARRVGFDVFYHDATWFEGASVVPGMNDWSKGLGTYRESREKFPHGLKSLSDAVQAAGMKFGLWVDPGNVDAGRVESGEIPRDWLAMIDAQPLGGQHPSLTPAKQLCLGNPRVVEWLKKELAGIVEQWNLEWIKWDPSFTVSHACNRRDHDHGLRNGAYAAYRGRTEILRYLLERFPQLSGFECDPSLHYSRTNPGPRDLLPGGYTNEFVTGPMVSPFVWGSLATAGKGDAYAAYLTGRWYSASALDYHLRKHLTHGISFGNINGMASQFLSQAPAGYIEALKRNLLYFRQYRHLLFDDVYHPKLRETLGWSAVEYVKEDSSESVVFVFRDSSETAQNKVYLRALDRAARYRVTSLNDRPGRDRVVEGGTLMTSGIAVKLPDDWLAKGDGMAGKEFEDQLRYGSDILLLRRLP